jgi:hypothetical protein
MFTLALIGPVTLRMISRLVDYILCTNMNEIYSSLVRYFFVFHLLLLTKRRCLKPSALALTVVCQVPVRLGACADKKSYEPGLIKSYFYNCDGVKKVIYVKRDLRRNYL